MARHKIEWFTKEGKPILHDGLYKNPNGKCFLYCFTLNQRRYKGSTHKENETQARLWLKAYKATLVDAPVGLAPKDVPTLRAVFDAWLSVRSAEVSASHVQNMRLAVTLHAAAYLDKPMNELDNMAANKIRSQYLDSTGKGFKTGGGATELSHNEGGANSAIKDLYALCGWAVEVGLTDARPFRLKKLKSTEPNKTVLWPEQVAAFLAEADKGNRVALSKEGKNRIMELCPHSATAARMMIFLGLREGETRFAEWGHVDWRLSVFRVGRGIVVEHEPKDREKREIPIPPSLLEHLKARWEEAGRPDQGLILPDRGKSNRKTEPNTPHQQQFSEKNIERAGGKILVKGLTPHALRRTFATAHYEIGTPISQIAAMMGHASPETTLKHYIVTRQKDQVEAQAKLDAAFGNSHLIPDPKKDGCK